jgi:AcrR family transcriptional regulator
VNQKRRTRKAILDAAQAIFDRGETPTIAAVADEALMTRQTVYRYFASQEALLLELDVSAEVDEFEELLSRPLDPTKRDARLLELLAQFHRFWPDHEALFRMASRHYNDAWLAAEREGRGHDQSPRQGRRVRWIDQALGPALDALPADERRRLVAALSLMQGGDAIMVLSDVCHLSVEESLEVTTWATQALLDAALGPAPG